MKSLVYVTVACMIACSKSGDDVYDFGDRSDWIDPSDMLNYDASTQRMKKPVAQKGSVSDDVGATKEKIDSAPSKNVQLDCTALREFLTKLYEQMTQTFPENKGTLVQTVRSYMSAYACENDETPKDEASDLQRCQTNLRELRKELRDVKDQQHSVSASLEKTYFKQYVRTLLQHYSGSVPDGSFLLYNSEILLNSDDIIILERFANSEYGNVQDAHEVLSRMIQHVELIQARDVGGWHSSISDHYKEYIILTLQVVAILTLASVAITLQVRLHLSWKQLLVKILILLFLISIPWNWWHMYKVAVAKRQAEAAKDIPLECRPERQTATQSLWTALRNTFTLNTDKCAEYYEKMLVDPAYEVAPTQALAVTVTKFVVEPLEHIGHAVGKLIHGTLQELPIQIWPFALAFICMMSLFILTLVFGYRIKLFYLFGIEPGKHTPRDSIRDKEQQKQLQDRIQDLSCQLERLTLAQNRQSALPVEDSSHPPVVSLFPSEHPSTPKRPCDDLTPPRAIEDGSTCPKENTQQDTRLSLKTESFVKDDPMQTTLTPTHSAGLKPNNVNGIGAKCENANNTGNQINILERPLQKDNRTPREPMRSDSGLPVSVAVQDENVRTNLCVTKTANNQPEPEQIDDAALDLTLDKVKNDRTALKPSVENLGAGDSSEDYK